VNKFTEENNRLHDEVNKLGGEVNRLGNEVDKFNTENNRLEGEVDKFNTENNRLQGEVDRLGGEVNKFSEENEKLSSIREALEMDVKGLSNKLDLFGVQLEQLQKTREMLDVQLERQAEQNKELATIASKQQSDFQQLMHGINESFMFSQDVLSGYSNENDRLRENRRQIKIDSYLAMSNSFSSWDHKSGLSVDEFKAYLELLGSDFEHAMIAKYGGNAETVFSMLDVDNNGSLNIPEVRKLLKDLVTDETVDEL